jgi:hypothetical protein
LSASKQSNISFVLPDESTRVQYFLTSIENCLDQKLISRIESVKSDDGLGGKNNDFDLCVQYLLPACPVYHWKMKEGVGSDPTNDGGNKRKNASVSDVNIKNGKGKTGVDFHWYKWKDFQALNKEQKDELCAWQRSAEGKKSLKSNFKQNDNPRKRPYEGCVNQNSVKFKKALAAAVKSNLEKEERDNEKQSKLASHIASALSELPQPPSAVGATAGLKARNAAVNAHVASILKSSNV